MTTIVVILVEVSFPLPPNVGIGDNQRVDESDDGQDIVDDGDDDNDRDISGSVDDLVNLGRGPVVVLWIEPGELSTVSGFLKTINGLPTFQLCFPLCFDKASPIVIIMTVTFGTSLIVFGNSSELFHEKKLTFLD